MNFQSLRQASFTLSLQTANEKNLALRAVAEEIDERRCEIISANKIDVENARKKNVSEPLIDRLLLTNDRIDGLIMSVQKIIEQPDPIGEEIAGWKTPNGLTIRQVRVPLGVVAMIYESRPNVTVDAFSLAYKSGNAILLRGSASAYNSNKAIVSIIKVALFRVSSGVPDAVELVEVKEGNHDDINEILGAVGKIDVVLPRGGKNLIKSVVENAKVPVIETGSGACHLYVDEKADLDEAVKIAENAKISRPGVCNAIECIVVHKKVLKEFLMLLLKKFDGRVELRCDDEAFETLENASGGHGADGVENANGGQGADGVEFSYGDHGAVVKKATESDFGCEFLDYVCAVKTVENINEAIEYINSHNTKHSECIVTENRNAARLFQAKIDASCVYVNASTRFTDGGEFGFGAELGISTQKLHARGPMGIKALTTTKFLIDGDGEVR